MYVPWLSTIFRNPKTPSAVHDDRFGMCCPQVTAYRCGHSVDKPYYCYLACRAYPHAGYDWDDRIPCQGEEAMERNVLQHRAQYCCSRACCDGDMEWTRDMFRDALTNPGLEEGDRQQLRDWVERVREIHEKCREEREDLYA